MRGEEEALVFDCLGAQLPGVLHPGAEQADCGVLVVVGGPQYRVGSHRQFVVMARALSTAGIPVLRFDCRGMGDGSGERVSFEELDAEIDAAVATLRSRLPKIRRVVLLGLCDGASAALINAHRRDDVAGMILINPWVRGNADGAHRPLRQYYLARLRQGGLWRKVSARQLKLFRSVGAFVRALADAGRQRSRFLGTARLAEPAFVDRMRVGLNSFDRPVLLLVSGDDLTGQEFLELCRSNPAWRTAVETARLRTRIVDGADHTMSSRKHLDEAVRECVTWLHEETGASVQVP